MIHPIYSQSRILVMDTAYPLYFSHRKEETHTAETTAAGWATDNVVEIVGI